MLPRGGVGSRRPGRSSPSGATQQHTQQVSHPGSNVPAVHACLCIDTSREPRRSELCTPTPPGNNTASRGCTTVAQLLALVERDNSCFAAVHAATSLHQAAILSTSTTIRLKV
ncbi:hypothetical protein FOA52_015181 [Chlamydomonas sp. UWO 241]|nr:hypothetical protein FOA52_015181 [Chlamydomonas sp. UWO 241]